MVPLGIYAAKKRYQYAITNKRVFSRKGRASRTISEIPLEKVTNTTYSQDFIGRILGFGNLKFNSSAGADRGVVFKGIKNPKSINKKFKEIKSSMQENQSSAQKIQQNLILQSGSGITKEKVPEYTEPRNEKKIDSKQEKLPELKEKKNTSKESESDELQTMKKAKKECPNCGEMIDRDWLVCGYCGEKIAKRCPECDAIMALGNYQCRQCGHEITEQCENCGKEIPINVLTEIEYCPECGEEVSDSYSMEENDGMVNEQS